MMSVALTVVLAAVIGFPKSVQSAEVKSNVYCTWKVSPATDAQVKVNWLESGDCRAKAALMLGSGRTLKVALALGVQPALLLMMTA